MRRYDVFVIGSGPAGQKAAVQAAKAGKRVAVCEQLREIGGACVQFGTIPSKALREKAVSQAAALNLMENLGVDAATLDVDLSALVGEMESVVKAHDAYMREQLERNGVEVIHGRASFTSATELNVRFVDGRQEAVTAEFIVIASGSRPRELPNIPVDHEHIFDSDSILSLAYLPGSLVVLGGGVIACEYASIFALLGVRVTLIDRYPRPLGFLDEDLSAHFMVAFEKLGGSFMPDTHVDHVRFDGVCSVETVFADGSRLNSDKLLCALGRVSQLEGLNLERSGVEVSDAGLVVVDGNGRTSVPGIYAAGDVIGPPSLASAAMEQGRRAACDFLNLPTGDAGEYVPTGIYAIPELASVGLTEGAAREQGLDFEVGYADFSEIARGHIADTCEGMLKLVVGRDRRLLGVHVIGSSATDLVHIGQLGLVHGATVDSFIDNVFNFPTYAESYRVAALHAARLLDAAGPVQEKSYNVSI